MTDLSPEFRERLGVPWWMWPTCVLVGLFVAVELTMGAPTLRVPPVYAGAVALVLAGLYAVGRIRVSVRRGELMIDDAHLPVMAIGSVTVVDGEARRRLLGLDAEPLAFVIQRPWISGGVRIDLADPDDPTPYWFVSSRRPAELAAALLAARNTAVGTPHVRDASG